MELYNGTIVKQTDAGSFVVRRADGTSCEFDGQEALAVAALVLEKEVGASDPRDLHPTAAVQYVAARILSMVYGA